MKKYKKLLFGCLCGLGSLSLLADEGEPLSIAEIAAYSPESFSTLTAALVSTDLTEVLNNEGEFTVFAPTNAAFDAAAKVLLEDESATGLDLLLHTDKEILEYILLYHVVPGAFFSGDVLATESFETASGDDIDIDAQGLAVVGGQGSVGGLILDSLDIEASNGVVHVIDGVLLPPVKEEPKTIVEIAQSNPEFSTLVAAVVKAGLVDFLSNEHYNLTVFAPLNSAFDATAQAVLRDEAATGEELVEALSPRDLRRILLNHVVFGEKFSDEVLDQRRFFTLAWRLLYRHDFTLKARNGSGTLVPGLIDLDASNGVVHVIDGVLVP